MNYFKYLVSESVLDNKSTNKGLLVPRLTTSQRNAIANPSNGLLVFDSDLNAFFIIPELTGLR